MNVIRITTANDSQFRAAIANGYCFQVEFGEPEADPMPGLAYFCKDIDTARKVYRARKHEGSLAMVKEWNGMESRSLFEGWVN